MNTTLISLLILQIEIDDISDKNALRALKHLECLNRKKYFIKNTSVCVVVLPLLFTTLNTIKTRSHIFGKKNKSLSFSYKFQAFAWKQNVKMRYIMRKKSAVIKIYAIFNLLKNLT